MKIWFERPDNAMKGLREGGFSWVHGPPARDLACQMPNRPLRLRMQFCLSQAKL